MRSSSGSRGSSRGDRACGFNAANEVAVAAFLYGRIAFGRIAELIGTFMDEHHAVPASVEVVRPRTRRREAGRVISATFLAFLVVLGVLIFVHELGHFWPPSTPGSMCTGSRSGWVSRSRRSRSGGAGPSSRCRGCRSAARSRWPAAREGRAEALEGGGLAGRCPAGCGLRGEAGLGTDGGDPGGRRDEHPVRVGDFYRTAVDQWRSGHPNTGGRGGLAATTFPAVRPLAQLRPGDTIVAVAAARFSVEDIGTPIIDGSSERIAL